MITEKYDVWFVDDNVDKQAEMLFGIPAGDKSRIVHEEVISTPQGQRRIVVQVFKESDPDQMAFALARGTIKPTRRSARRQFPEEPGVIVPLP